MDAKRVSGILAVLLGELIRQTPLSYRLGSDEEGYRRNPLFLNLSDDSVR